MGCSRATDPSNPSARLLVSPNAFVAAYVAFLRNAFFKLSQKMFLQIPHTRPTLSQAWHPDKAPPNPTQIGNTRTPPLSKTVPRTDELTQAAKDRAASLVEEYVPTAATEADLRCIEERQLRHKAGSSSGSVGVPPSPCRHGFPQAFSFDPCGHKVRCRRLR